MAKQDVRYYLNGLTIELKADSLSAIASDGHRLASNCVPAQNISNTTVRVILPYKGTLELLRLLTDSDEVIDVLISSNHARIIALSRKVKINDIWYIPLNIIYSPIKMIGFR